MTTTLPAVSHTSRWFITILSPKRRPGGIWFIVGGLFVLLLSSCPVSAQKTFDFNENCQQAYREIIQLKLDRGAEMLRSEKIIHPDNLIPDFLENYVDFFVLFFNEDPAEFKVRKKNLDSRLQLMNQGPSSSPFFRFTKAVIYFQWAAIKIKFGSYWEAGWEFRRSFLLDQENQDLFPAFLPGSMLNGAMQVAAGTIPDGYTWLGNLLGIRGSVTAGIRQLEAFLGQSEPWAQLFHDEGVFYYLYLKFYIQNERSEVFKYIRKNELDVINNRLFAYLATNLAVNDQRADYARGIMELMNPSSEYLSMPVWDLEMGYVTLYHLEPDAAHFLMKFIAEFRGKFYVKDVLHKLSWFYYLSGDMGKARMYRELTLTQGSIETEADKQALMDARSGKWPDPLLLKARLLSDGGYWQEAFSLVQGKSSADFPYSEERLEFAYRLGRIYDGLGRDDEAIAAYLTTIKLGQKRREYYAARAALQIGFIYEKRGDKLTAQSYFQKVLNLKDHEYKNSLDQRAKAGIARCRNQ
jgi:tetratricopeptide (TPR) repeat protein